MQRSTLQFLAGRGPLDCWGPAEHRLVERHGDEAKRSLASHWELQSLVRQDGFHHVDRPIVRRRLDAEEMGEQGVEMDVLKRRNHGALPACPATSRRSPRERSSFTAFSGMGMISGLVRPQPSRRLSEITHCSNQCPDLPALDPGRVARSNQVTEGMCVPDPERRQHKMCLPSEGVSAEQNEDVSRLTQVPKRRCTSLT